MCMREIHMQLAIGEVQELINGCSCVLRVVITENSNNTYVRVCEYACRSIWYTSLFKLLTIHRGRAIDLLRNVYVLYVYVYMFT